MQPQLALHILLFMALTSVGLGVTYLDLVRHAWISPEIHGLPTALFWFTYFAYILTSSLLYLFVHGHRLRVLLIAHIAALCLGALAALWLISIAPQPSQVLELPTVGWLGAVVPG